MDCKPAHCNSQDTRHRLVKAQQQARAIQRRPIKGTDFAVLKDGRIQSVTGFLDQVPAGA